MKITQLRPGTTWRQRRTGKPVRIIATVKRPAGPAYMVRDLTGRHWVIGCQRLLTAYQAITQQ